MGLLDLFKSADKVGEGIKKATGGIGDAVTNIISSSKGQLTPQAKAQIEELKLNVGVKIQELMAESEKTFRDFTLKYEGAANEIPKWLLVVRSIIRPMITIFMFIAFMIFMSVDIIAILKSSEGTLLLTKLPQAFWWIFGIIIGFWFGGKIGENIAGKMKK